MMYETDLPLMVKTFYKKTNKFETIKVPKELDATQTTCSYSIQDYLSGVQVITKFQADISGNDVIIPESLLAQLHSGYYIILLVFIEQTLGKRFETIKLHIKDL